MKMYRNMSAQFGAYISEFIQRCLCIMLFHEFLNYSTLFVREQCKLCVPLVLTRCQISLNEKGGHFIWSHKELKFNELFHKRKHGKMAANSFVMDSLTKFLSKMFRFSLISFHFSKYAICLLDPFEKTTLV